MYKICLLTEYLDYLKWFYDRLKSIILLFSAYLMCSLTSFFLFFAFFLINFFIILFYFLCWFISYSTVLLFGGYVEVLYYISLSYHSISEWCYSTSWIEEPLIVYFPFFSSQPLYAIVTHFAWCVYFYKVINLILHCYSFGLNSFIYWKFK